MSITLVRCPVGFASSDIMMVVASVLLGGDLLPALPVTTVLCPPPATVLYSYSGLSPCPRPRRRSPGCPSPGSKRRSRVSPSSSHATAAVVLPSPQS